MTGNQPNDFQTEIISVIAHELKTPVGAAKGFLELIEQSGPLNSSQEHFSKRAMQALRRMELLIGNLLNLARLDGSTSLHKTDFSLGGIIREHVELLQDMAAARQIDILVSDNVDDILVHGDVTLLSQVVSNLLSNAIKYNRDGGEVVVRVTIEAGLIRVDIADTGLGIPVDDQSHVFERFFRSRNSRDHDIEGTGLGLAITQLIISAHGERIWLESTPEEGTTFSFTLPLVRQNASNATWDDIDADTASEQPDAVEDDSQEARDEISDSDLRDDGI
jgi:two-component system phosphate regulon sensor histidine kinase PhoR